MTAITVITMDQAALQSMLDQAAAKAVQQATAAQPPADGALNTIAAMFHSGEEIEGPDGLAVMVDMSVWNAALDSFEGIIGDEMEPAQPQASLPTVEQVEASMGMGHGAWDMVDPNELIKAIVTLAAAPKAEPLYDGDERRHVICLCPECVRAEPAPASQEAIDDAAVDALVVKMKSKLARKRAEGRGGWETCSQEYLSRLLRMHVDKGDPIDVANFCAFLAARGEGIAQPETSAASQDAEDAI